MSSLAGRPRRIDLSLTLSAIVDTTSEVVPEAYRLAGDLIAQQRGDGLWDGDAWLRVTRNDCAAPWHRPLDGGTLYCDEGIVTSATAIRVLGRLGQRMR